jgi:hypothetical protein
MTKKRHKKVLALAKGYRGVRSSAFKHAKIATMKAASTPTKIVVERNVISASSGLSVSTLQFVLLDSHTLVSSTACT